MKAENTSLLRFSRNSEKHKKSSNTPYSAAVISDVVCLSFISSSHIFLVFNYKQVVQLLLRIFKIHDRFRKNVKYVAATFDLNKGDFLFFHSDGLIEVLNAQQDMYGTERLNDLIANIPSESSAEEMIQFIFDDVQEFVQEAEQYDDMPLVVLKRHIGA